MSESELTLLYLEQFYANIRSTIGRQRETYFLAIEELRSIDVNTQRVKESIDRKEDMTLANMLGNIRKRNQALERRLDQLKEEHAELVH